MKRSCLPFSFEKIALLDRGWLAVTQGFKCIVGIADDKLAVLLMFLPVKVS